MMKNVFKQSILLMRHHEILQNFARRSSPLLLSKCVQTLHRLEGLRYSSSAVQTEHTNNANELLRQNNKTDSPELDRIIENKFVMLRCCVGMWEDFQQGAMFDTGFIDTHINEKYNPSTQTVLLLHDVFGNHTDFIPIIKPLYKLGYRVIAPSFPGNEYTKGACLFDDFIFTHGTDEQVSFLDALLGVINVERIDMVVGHGSGAHPATVFGAYSVKEKVKSVGLICPAPHKQTRKYNISDSQKVAIGQWDIRRLRFLIYPYLWITKHKMGLPKEVPLKRVMSILQNINGLVFNQYAGHLMALKSKQKPLFLVYSGQDEAVETEISEEFANVIGYKKSAFYVIDEQNKVKTKGDTEGYPKGLFLESGSHNPLNDHATSIVKLIWNTTRILNKAT